MRRTSIVRILVLCCPIVWMAGCQRSEDPAVLATRQKVLLSAEPEGALSVVEARQVATSELQPVVLVGRVGAGVDATWDPGTAAFVVADLSTSPEEVAHEHAGDHSHCPFCAAKAAKEPERTALVRVVDEAGSVIPVDARRLLAIQEQQTVVVRGKGHIDDLGNLVVLADGVYPRR